MNKYSILNIWSTYDLKEHYRYNGHTQDGPHIFCSNIDSETESLIDVRAESQFPFLESYISIYCARF